jgi:hypothetical protein
VQRPFPAEAVVAFDDGEVRMQCHGGLRRAGLRFGVTGPPARMRACGCLCCTHKRCRPRTKARCAALSDGRSCTKNPRQQVLLPGFLTLLQAAADAATSPVTIAAFLAWPGNASTVDRRWRWAIASDGFPARLYGVPGAVPVFPEFEAGGVASPPAAGGGVTEVAAGGGAGSAGVVSAGAAGAAGCCCDLLEQAPRASTEAASRIVQVR